MSDHQSTSSNGAFANAVADRRATRANNSAKRANDAEKLKLEGNALYMKGDWVGAADRYAQAINIHGPKPVLMSNMAAAYLKLELFDEAEWAATTALEYDPSSVKARYRRAMARKGLTRFKSAKTDLQCMLAQEPNNKEAKKEMQSIEAQMKADPGLPAEPHEDQPRHDDLPWPLLSESETEDCKHVGSFTACRFYNHAGCARGSECNFSHAPDAKSVRDEIGKNVCVHFLIGDCSFGAKCLYSHSRKYLPPQSWWDDPVQLQAAKTTLPYVDDFADHAELHAVLLKHPSARTYASLQEREAVLDHLKRQLADAKTKLTRRKSSTSTKPLQTPDKFVLVLSLDWEDAFAEMQSHLFAGLDKKVGTVHIRNFDQVSKALECLESPSLVSVLITDIGITKREYAKVLNKLVAYVKNGGSATIGCSFPSFIRPPDFSKFFKTAWGLDWKMGNYFRTDFSVNPSNEIVKQNPSLVKSYSMKSSHIDGITPEMAIYRQTDNSSTQSPREAPAVCAPVGRGRLCVLGDVNAEEESTTTILAMLGVLDQLKQPRAGVAQPQAAKLPEVQKPQTKNAKASSSTEAQKISSGKGSSKTSDKFVLLLELEGDTDVQQKFSKQLSELAKKITLKTAYDAREAVPLLASPNLHGVYVVDEGIQNIQNMGVLGKLGEYVRSGGLVVIGGMFGPNIDEESITVIFSVLGLRWSRGSFCKCEAQQNRQHETAVRNPGLSDAFYMKAVHLRGFQAEDLFYEQYFDEYDTNPNFRPPGGDSWEAPALRSRVGKGYVGYIGDVSPEPESTDILLAMLELLTTPKTLEPYSTKFLMMLTGFEEPFLQKFVPNFMKDLRGKVEVVMGLSGTGLSNARIVDLLPSKDLIGVFIGDTNILHPENAYLLSKLVEYSKNGGTVVFGWQFCRDVTMTQFRPLFRDNWSLDWDVVGYVECSVERNFENPLFKGKRSEDLKLPKKTRFEGIQVKGIAKEAAVYYSLTRKDLWSADKNIYMAAVLFTEVEKGRLGYIGSANTDGECRDIIYTMFGLV